MHDAVTRPALPLNRFSALWSVLPACSPATTSRSRKAYHNLLCYEQLIPMPSKYSLSFHAQLLNCFCRFTVQPALDARHLFQVPVLDSTLPIHSLASSEARFEGWFASLGAGGFSA
jgi:hypothetical protein